MPCLLISIFHHLPAGLIYLRSVQLENEWVKSVWKGVPLVKLNELDVLLKSCKAKTDSPFFPEHEDSFKWGPGHMMNYV